MNVYQSELTVWTQDESSEFSHMLPLHPPVPCAHNKKTWQLQIIEHFRDCAHLTGRAKIISFCFVLNATVGLFVFQQQYKQGRRKINKTRNAAFWSKSSPNYLERGGESNTTDFFFFLFLSLGSVWFSLDTHYKVNSNFVLGHSGKTQGCPQAKAWSHTLWFAPYLYCTHLF